MTPGDNILSRAWQAGKKMTINPLALALATGVAGYGATRLGYNAITNTARSWGRPFMSSQEETDMAVDELQAPDSSIRKWAPWVVGGLAASVPLIMNFDPASRGYGLTRFTKRSSDNPFENENYQPMVDFRQVINAREASDLFTNDPYLQQHNRYVMNLGTAIVNDAAKANGGRVLTLGNLYDSTVDKINTKLSVQGLTSIGVKSVLANGTARLLAGAMGSIFDLSPETRKNIVDTGTWAGTVEAILN